MEGLETRLPYSMRGDVSVTARQLSRLVVSCHVVVTPFVLSTPGLACSDALLALASVRCDAWLGRPELLEDQPLAYLS